MKFWEQMGRLSAGRIVSQTSVTFVSASVVKVQEEVCLHLAKVTDLEHPYWRDTSYNVIIGVVSQLITRIIARYNDLAAIKICRYIA